MLREIKEFRLQPLVELHSGKIIAHEILSSVINKDPEQWFSSLSKETVFSLFLWQAEYALTLSGIYWLNLPVNIFCDVNKVNEILKIKHENRLVLEIQDPKMLLNYSRNDIYAFEKGIYLLRQAEWIIWLDDITSSLISLVGKMSLNVDGIKIDRQEIRYPKTISTLISRAFSISPHVLVEGIETVGDKQQMMLTKATYGQGFLWPEKKVHMAVPPRFRES
jgi:EAL domain-containing protein (putative c-di-GMP-specific phosphodiesterase class I)